jgi:hypothetical protein
LLLEESFRRILRRYLEGVYAQEDASTTAIVQQAAQKCPTVFATLFNLPLVDRGLDNQVSILKTELFQDIRLWEPCSPTSSKQFNVPTRIYDLPVNHSFLQLLRSAYTREYQFENVSSPGQRPIHWYNKISFFHRQVTDIYPVPMELFKYAQSNVITMVRP